MESWKKMKESTYEITVDWFEACVWPSSKIQTYPLTSQGSKLVKQIIRLFKFENNKGRKQISLDVPSAIYLFYVYDFKIVQTDISIVYYRHLCYIFNLGEWKCKVNITT